MGYQDIAIRKAGINDIDTIIEFIRLNWQQDHIFVKERSLFEYQHLIDNNFNFVVAEDVCTNVLYGICGYIPSNNSKNNKTMWGAILKVIKNGSPALGINLLDYIANLSDCSIFAGCGINAKTIPIYDFMGYSTGKLEHYYRIDNRETYQVAVINDKKIADVKYSDFKLVRLHTYEDFLRQFDIEEYKDRKPYKDNWYICRRYYNYPINKYHVYGIQNGNNEIKSILVARETSQNGAKLLRIVDFIGRDDDLDSISSEIQRLIDENEYEYIDFYCHGINEVHFKNAGFERRISEDNNIIPNYFGPFLQKNIDIYFFTNDCENFYMFKADGDQDRPSCI